MLATDGIASARGVIEKLEFTRGMSKQRINRTEGCFH